MTALIGGVVALIVGVILLIVWWGHFLTVLAGAIPILLLLGGALAFYLGLEELKDRRQIEAEMASPPPPPPPPPSQEEMERYKQEAEKYKAEVEELKKKLATDEEKEEEEA